MNYKTILNAVISLAIVFFIFMIVKISMNYGGLEWYQTLNLPDFIPNPQIMRWIYPALYTMIALAIFNILNHYQEYEIWSLIWLFTTHFLFHMSWGYVFFLLKSPFWGWVVTEAMWFSLIALVVTTFYYSVLSAVLLLPYLAWLTFVTVLSFKIYQLN